MEISGPSVVDDEEEKLHLPVSDGEGEDKLRMKCWSKADANNPTFSVGLVFPTIEKLRQVIT